MSEILARDRVGGREQRVFREPDLSLHFEGLANPTRLRIVERLAATPEIGVSQLAELCRVSQPRMSWHLRILRRAQVISTRRDGREVFCRLDKKAIAAYQQRFISLLSGSVDDRHSLPIQPQPGEMS